MESLPVANYLGACSASYLWIDIDLEGQLEEATNKMIEVVQTIGDKYGLSYKSLVVYFSGRRATMLECLTASFGASDYYSELLLRLLNRWRLR